MIAGLPSYRPGKGAKHAEAEHGISNAIKLASNENPAPPTDAIVAAVCAAATGTHRYADHRASELRGALAEWIGAPWTVTLGALSVTVFATLVFLLSPELRRLPAIESGRPERPAAP